MGVLPVDHALGVRAVIYRAGMASCAGTVGWCGLGAGQTHGDGGVAGDGRVMAFRHKRCFHKYHRVLSHTRWSVLAASRLLLGELLAALAPPAGTRRYPGHSGCGRYHF
jgi:hypothetical protein